MFGHQYKPVRLASIPYAAGGNVVMKFDKLMAQLGGRIAHLRGISFSVRATPTLSSGTATAVELNQLVKTLIVRDCARKRFEGSFASLRAFEAYENGRLRCPEPDGAATGEQVNFVRYFDVALSKFLRPHDFVDPAAVWMDGTIEFGFAALTEVDANCTALNATIEVTAWVFAADDLLFGSVLERKEQTINRDVAIPQECLMPFMALAKTSAFGVFTANDVGNLALYDEATVLDRVDRRVYEDGYHRDFDVGAFSEIHGDLRAATDDNAKVVNGTALAAAASYVQPVAWVPPGGRLSKIQYTARPNLTVSNDGTLTTFYALMSRILPRDSQLLGTYLGACKNKLGIDPNAWAPKKVTLNKDDYKGPRVEYIPLKLKRPGA